MRKAVWMCLSFLLVILIVSASAIERFIPSFPVETDDMTLERLAQPNTYFDKVGRRFAILGFESGQFEAWAYPLKLLRNFELSFFIGTSTQPVLGRDIVRYIQVTPAATMLTYTFQSFTAKAIFITPVEEPGAIILLRVDSTEPLTIAASFIPVLQPMWPAGIGGQYAHWDNNLKAYLISEPTRKNHGFVGSPAAKGISYTPAHMLSDTPNEFIIEIEEGEAVKGKYIPIILAGGKGKREDVRQVYERLAVNPEAYYRQNLEYFRKLRENTLRVRTPDNTLNLAFEWTKISLDNLRVDNPDLGRGLVAGLGPSGLGGRPGFGWFFGGDAYIISLSLNSFGAFTATKEALVFTRKWQREDGKMAHELSQAAGYIDWFKDYPYGYIHGDTTPYYIAAAYDYFRMSGDAEFIQESWPSLRRAYDWCLATDEDGDGLMDNKKAGLGALEFGALTGIQTDIYLAAVWIRAAYAMRRLAGAMGDSTYEKKSAEQYAKALRAFEAKFWDDETQHYVYAFNADARQVKELTPWSSVALMWKLGEAGRSSLSLQKMSSAALTTDWGIRMLSTQSPLFQPLNYNYGAAWPFVTGLAATAYYKNNFSLQGYQLLKANARHVFDNALGHVTELYSGSQCIWPQEGVPHQGFCAGGVVLPFVRGMIGLEGDAVERLIVFEPRFPADWKDVHIENYKVGNETFSFRYEREENKVKAGIHTQNENTYTMIFAPALGVGTKVLRVLVNGRPAEFETVLSSQAIQPSVRFSLTGSDSVEVEFSPVVEILPPRIEPKVGDTDKGLKIIKVEGADAQLRIFLEGLAGKSYILGITHPHLVAEVNGAKLEGSHLNIQIPSTGEKEFLPHEIVLKLKED